MELHRLGLNLGFTIPNIEMVRSLAISELCLFFFFKSAKIKAGFFFFFFFFYL